MASSWRGEALLVSQVRTRGVKLRRVISYSSAADLREEVVGDVRLRSDGWV